MASIPIQPEASTISPARIEAKTYDLLSELYLPDCYVSQGEYSHIKKERGTVYATDIGCHGEYFDVYAPKFNDLYTIKEVGKDPRIGSYVVLAYGQYKLIFGHTETIYKVGDFVTKGTKIGKINKTGITTGPHLHLEKWKGDKNITLDGKDSNKWSDALIAQRSNKNAPSTQEIITIATKIIKKYECGGGPHLKAYWDYKGYTIGCGTRSYSGEVITAIEADRRLRAVVAGVVSKTVKDFNGLNSNQYAALASLFFNCQKGYNRLKSNGISETNFKSCKMANGRVLGGLEKRRNEERSLFNL